MGKYKALLLDMDHTLCDTESADRRGLADFQQLLAPLVGRDRGDRIGVDYLAAVYGRFRGDGQWRRWEDESEEVYRARLLHQLFLEYGCKTLMEGELRQLAGSFMAMRIGHYDFFPGVVEMLARLRRHRRLVVVSNGPLFSQQPKIVRTAMAEHVDHILLGGALAHQKPHPSIFWLACEKAGCSPGDSLHIGDSLEADVAGARAAGIDSVWITGHNATAISGEHPPTYTIEHVLELETLLLHQAGC